MVIKNDVFIRKSTEIAGADNVLSRTAPVSTEEKRYNLHSGQAVFHGKFGDGVILALEGQGKDARAKVNFGQHGIKWLALKVANLIPQDGKYIKLPWYFLEPHAYGSPLQSVTIRRRAVSFLVGVGPAASPAIRAKASVIPLVKIPEVKPTPEPKPKPKKVRVVPQHKGKFTIGEVWTQNVIDGKVGYNINTERKLRFHADMIGFDHTGLNFSELLMALGEKLASA